MTEKAAQLRHGERKHHASPARSDGRGQPQTWREGGSELHPPVRSPKGKRLQIFQGDRGAFIESERQIPFRATDA
jgi:hypothetical protein